MTLQPNLSTTLTPLTRNYILYVLVFTYDYISNDGKQIHKYCKQPIYIRDSEAKINKYGLYDMFYSAGVLVYKPFDYFHQCNVTPNILESMQTINKCYTYLCDNYKNMYPINDKNFDQWLQQNNINKKYLNEKSYENKYLKYKSKYLKLKKIVKTNKI